LTFDLVIFGGHRGNVDGRGALAELADGLLDVAALVLGDGVAVPGQASKCVLRGQWRPRRCEGVQGGDFAAAFVDPYVVVGEFASGACAVLLSAQIDQRQRLGALVRQFVQVGGVGCEVTTR
jgi:hypothetical protein